MQQAVTVEGWVETGFCDREHALRFVSRSGGATLLTHAISMVNRTGTPAQRLQLAMAAVT